MIPATCPNCGADVPRRARACPECGADESTGWSEESAYSDLDLPDEDFNYDDFIKREFGGKKWYEKMIPHGIHPAWWIVAVLVTAFALYLFSRWK